jgi:hypothetical protein
VRAAQAAKVRAAQAAKLRGAQGQAPLVAAATLRGHNPVRLATTS